MFLWMVLTWTYNDYPNQGILILRCFGAQIGYMATYWIARNVKKDVIVSIIRSAYIPLIITAIIGIYCFFYSPSWYVYIVEESLYNREGTITENRYLEAFRLRSIFPSHYTLSYFCAVTLIYEFFLIIKKKHFKYKNLHYALIVLLVITMLLTMTRAPLFCMIIGLVVALFYGYRYLNVGRAIIVTASLFVVGLISIPFVLDNMSTSSSNQFISKIQVLTDNTDEFVTNRMYSQQKGTEIIGDGVGRHDMHADKYNPNTSIRDSEYMKIIAEQGYIGLFIFGVFIAFAVYNCIFNFRYLSLELCMIVMFLICMIGANPLSAGDKHTIIFWLALGRISKLSNANEIIRNFVIDKKLIRI